MRIIITESQKRMLLFEIEEKQLNDEIENSIENNIDFTKEIVKEAEKLVEEGKLQIGLNLRFLLTWGAGVGGFIKPIYDFITNNFSDISEKDKILIIIAIMATYYFDNKEKLIKIKDEIRKRGLSEIIQTIFTKADELIKVFSQFLLSLGKTFHSITNLLSYAFLIPILDKLIILIKNSTLSTNDLTESLMSLLGFGTLTFVGIGVKNLIENMVRRFKGK
jgi:hypothetical protein